MKTFVAFVAVVAAALVSAEAFATTDYVFSGNQCVDPLGDNDNFGWDEKGVYGSVVSGGGYVYCPVGGRNSTTVNVDQTIIRYYDGHNDNTAYQANVYCLLEITNSSGSTYDTSTKYSCSTSGGCDSPYTGPTYTGYNQLELGDQFVSQNNIWTYTVKCHIPNYGEATSRILGYSVTQVDP